MRASGSTSPQDPEETRQPLKPLPPAALLLSIPALLVHPPTHPLYIPSLATSIEALRKCLLMEALPQDLECRACTALAEIGLRVMKDGLDRMQEQKWAANMSVEVEKAIGRGLQLSQTNPSLAVYKHTLTYLHASHAFHHQNYKFARNLLKRITGSLDLQPPCPSWMIYTAYLTSISYALEQSPPDVSHALATIDQLKDITRRRMDLRVALLTNVLYLRTLMDAGMWDRVGDALFQAEVALGLSYDSPSEATPKPRRTKSPQKLSTGSPEKARDMKDQDFVLFENPMEVSMVLHVLIIGITYYIHCGNAKEASPRLSHLHALLDSDVLGKFPGGTVTIKLTSGAPLRIQCTHPHVLYNLTFLISSVAKRDVVGRKPKRKVFALEGLKTWETELKKEIKLRPGATRQDAMNIEGQMVQMKADLLSEIVAVCIMRNEFDDAEEHLAALIAHTRSNNIFNKYSARITLHHAHLAHVLGDGKRARDCYRAAAYLSGAGSYIYVAAVVGEIGLRIGEADDKWSEKNEPDHTNGVGRMAAKTDEERMERYMLSDMLREVALACEGNGGTLKIVGHILEANLSTEIMTAKAHLKIALDLASRSQDSHLRALILALVSSLYLRTAESHARTMLDTCGRLAVGFGVSPVPEELHSSEKGKQMEEDTPTGNLYLGLWVGECFLELYQQDGDSKKARKQQLVNERYRTAIEQLSEKRRLLLPP